MTRRKTAGLAGFTGDVSAADDAAADPDPSVREAGLRSLDRLDHLPDERLAAALRDPESRVRIAAIELAAPRLGPPISPLLADDDPRVVEMACWGCGEREHDPDPPIAELCALVTEHDDPLVREAAVAGPARVRRARGRCGVGAGSTRP